MELPANAKYTWGTGKSIYATLLGKQKSIRGLIKNGFCGLFRTLCV